ncbi:MAG TPA: hypothetical protein VIA18_21345, partial [Polyangia bacterium]|nr:hypothetical protein [Polyangia bacterium]
MSLSLFAGPFSRLYEDADVLGWRKKLERKVRLACDWDESEDAPERSVESGSFHSWDALRLAVAYHQHPQLKRPKKLPEWVSDDPAWKSLVKPGFPLRFN